MDINEYSKRSQQLKEEAKISQLKLLIDRDGPCPHHKGHFDKASFWTGLIISIFTYTITIMLIGSLMHK